MTPLPPHTCQCRRCGDFPTGPRLGEQHVAVRFGQDDRRLYDVFMDGQKLPRCTEAMAGRYWDGWAIVMMEPTHPCFNHAWGGDDCQHRITGDISIVRMVPARPRSLRWPDG